MGGGGKFLLLQILSSNQTNVTALTMLLQKLSNKIVLNGNSPAYCHNTTGKKGNAFRFQTKSHQSSKHLNAFWGQIQDDR